ncbi:MAG: circadian clock KaiB family protein [Anaerolineae bacterium]|nr:circadian clock KaiB family protein [Anaerolineae bacterium]
MNFPAEDGQLSAAERIVLRLYVAGSGPNSIRAKANLNDICRRYLPDCQLEVIDILANSASALAEGILVTPTLIRVSPLPLVRVVGDLSKTSIVLQALGLEEKK